MNKSESITKLAAALAKFQGEIKNPNNTAVNPFFKSKYAPLEEVLNTVRPILSKHGLSILQSPISSEGMVGVNTILLHESGEWIEFTPVMLNMDKPTAQGAGSAITYARRYAISAILGINSEDDDDGNNAEPKGKVEEKPQAKSTGISEKQVLRMYMIAKSAEVDKATVDLQIKTKLNKTPEELTRAEYDKICTAYEGLKKGDK